MKFNIFKRCKHDYDMTGYIGGDIQNTAFKCKLCGKKRVTGYGRAGKLDYQEIVDFSKKHKNIGRSKRG